MKLCSNSLRWVSDVASRSEGTPEMENSPDSLLHFHEKIPQNQLLSYCPTFPLCIALSVYALNEQYTMAFIPDSSNTEVTNLFCP